MPPRDSDDEHIEEFFAPINEEIISDDETNVEVMTLNENDEHQDLDELTEEMGIDDDIDIENGYIADDSVMIFQQHTGSVFTVSLSNLNKSMVVSGGEDDHGYVWKIENGEILFHCDSHKDSVISCGFNVDDKLVMTADMLGLVNVWNVSDGKKIWDFECSDLEWCFWHSSINVLFAGTTDGEIYMWKIPSGECKIYPGHGSKAMSAKLLPNGKELLSAYEDATLKIWDLKTATATFSSHSDTETFLCVDCQFSENLIACGTLGGVTKIFSVSSGKLVANLALPNPITSDSDDESSVDNHIESIAFSPTENYIASGSLDGTLQIWDLTAQRLRHKCEHPSGVTCVIWNENDPTIITTACTDGTLRQWDYRNGELVKTFKGHKDSILDVCISKDGKTILSAGDDNCVRVFVK